MMADLVVLPCRRPSAEDVVVVQIVLTPDEWQRLTQYADDIGCAAAVLAARAVREWINWRS
ncbi:MAG: hypothetical protein IRZ09_15235 [Variibacter sp.]|nr:hypothetical protein [Variibacter sp.]